ncbi:hypothetical protein XANCAGTX0491_009287 [Xanthoria calcicola]
MLFHASSLILLWTIPGLVQSSAQVPPQPPARGPVDDPTSGVYPPDNPREPWPTIPDRNFSLSTDSLPDLARPLSRSGVMSVMDQVLGQVRKHVQTKGNTYIPSSLDPAGPIEVAVRGIQFQICSLLAAGLTQWYADPDSVDDDQLRWNDIVPIISVLRAKMARDAEWRERAVWITQKVTNVRLGAARIVRTPPDYGPGSPDVELGRCDY